MRFHSLMLIFALGGLVFAEADKPRDCPLCGGHDVTFDDTADGTFKEFRFAVVTRDVDLLRRCTDVADEKFLAGLKTPEDWQGLLVTAGSDADVAKMDGDRATIRVHAKKGDIDLALARTGGAWRIVFGPLLDAIRGEGTDRDCTNNLRQLGTYIVMWVSKFGNDRIYPGPGLKLLTMLTEPKTDILGKGNERLFYCGASGDPFDAEAIRRGDAAAIGYECCETAIVDGKTPVNAPIAWDKKPCHDGKRHVLLFCNAVETMTEEQFQEARKRWK